MWRIVVIHDASGREVYKKEHNSSKQYLKDFQRIKQKFRENGFELMHESDNTATFRKRGMVYHVLGIEYISVPKR